MLKKIRLLILTLIAIIWFIIILPYFLIQTELGAKYVSQLISYCNNDYAINIGHISHVIKKPYEITLENVTIADKTQPITYLSVNKVTLGLKHDRLLQTQSLDYLLLEDGYIEASPTTQNIDADFLQLKNISLHYKDMAHQIEFALNNIYGGIKPWSKEVITERVDSQFNFTIEKASYNSKSIKSIFAQGHQQDNVLYLTNLGGDIGSGFFTTNASVLADNTILINQLKINKLHFQAKNELSDINQLFANLPKTDIQQLSIIDSSINLANLSVEKANLEIKNITYDKSWQLQKSSLFFNAQSIVWNEQLIEQPLLQWYNQGKKIIIEQAIGLWNKGSIKLSASWQSDNLTIDNIIASGIRYQLPQNWWQQLTELNLSTELPNHILIKQFMLMPSLLIDTNPAFPFQFTNFEAFGNNIEIGSIENAIQVNGTLLFKADSGTINTIELKKPDLSLNLSSSNNNSSFSALINQGMLEGNVDFNSPKQLQSLAISAHSINSKVLSSWYLINQPINSDNFTVKLHGDLIPLSLSGTLLTADRQYQVLNNQLIDY